MLRKISSLLVLGVTALSVASCAVPTPEEARQTALEPWRTEVYPSSQASTPSLTSPLLQPHRKDMASLIYLAAQTLSDRAELLDKSRPIIVATVVSVDDFNKSSTFGRLASELVANRIEQRGYLVKDIRYMHAFEFERKTGEFVLSREAAKVSAEFKAQAVVAGTYAVAGKEIYLNLRLLSANGGELLSSADVVIPLDSNTEPLVGDGSIEEQLETFDQFEQRIGRTLGG